MCTKPCRMRACFWTQKIQQYWTWKILYFSFYRIFCKTKSIVKASQIIYASIKLYFYRCKWFSDLAAQQKTGIIKRFQICVYHWKVWQTVLRLSDKKHFSDVWFCWWFFVLCGVLVVLWCLFFPPLAPSDYHLFDCWLEHQTQREIPCSLQCEHRKQFKYLFKYS